LTLKTLRKWNALQAEANGPNADNNLKTGKRRRFLDQKKSDASNPIREREGLLNSSLRSLLKGNIV
jgi:hypothetical protein